MTRLIEINLDAESYLSLAVESADLETAGLTRPFSLVSKTLFLTSFDKFTCGTSYFNLGNSMCEKKYPQLKGPLTSFFRAFIFQ